MTSSRSRALSLALGCAAVLVACKGGTTGNPGNGGATGSPGNLVAHIVVDEPAAYGSNGNLCPPEDGSCYFPDLGLSLTRGYAPFAVFFQGWSSTPRGDIVAWLWDFGEGTEGDPHGRSFSGFNAAHVFETPGSYTVTLQVLNASGNVASATIPVTVLAPGRTFYVDANIGNDACDGRSDTVASATHCPWRTADKALSSMARPAQWAPVPQWHYQPGDRILFRRGQTFDLTAVVAMGYGLATQGYTFGAYGDGAKPVIQWRGGTGGYMIDTGLGFGYVGFEDLAFAFLNPAGGQLDGLLAPICGAKNVLCLRCDFREPNNGAFATNGGDCRDQPVDSSFFLVDSSVANPLTHATSVTQAYFFGVHGLALMNDTFDQSGNHSAYTGPIDKGLVWHNAFARPAFGRTAWRSTGGPATLTDNNIYFADNQFLGWIDPVSDDHAHNGGGTNYNYHLINLAPGGNDGEHLIEDVVFERNVVTNFQGGMNVVNGRNVTVRNNLFVSPAPYGTFLYLSDAPDSLGLTRPLQNVRIIGNTFVATSPGEGTEFIRIYPWTSGATTWGSNHTGVVVENNLFYAAAGRDAVAVNLIGTDNGLLSGLSVDHNLVFVPGAADAASFQIAGVRQALASWRTTTGYDAHTAATDPRFAGVISAVGYVPGEPSYAQDLADVLAYESALHLTAASPLCGGDPVPVDSYFDFDLVSRFAGDACVDVGAYEYVAR